MERITMSASEVAELLGVSVNTIYTMVRENEIPYRKVRGRILFHRETVEKWLLEPIVV